MNSVTLYCLDVDIYHGHRKYYSYIQSMGRRQAMNGFNNYFLRQKFDPKKQLHFRKDVL